MNNVQQESTRRQLLILRYPTVLIAKVAIIALEVVLNQHVVLVRGHLLELHLLALAHQLIVAMVTIVLMVLKHPVPLVSGHLLVHLLSLARHVCLVHGVMEMELKDLVVLVSTPHSILYHQIPLVAYVLQALGVLVQDYQLRISAPGVLLVLGVHRRA